MGFGGTAVVGTVIGTVKTGKKLGELAGQLGEGSADGPTAELGPRLGGRIEIPSNPLPDDDWDRTLGPLLSPAELAEATSSRPSGDLTDADRDRAKKGAADASTRGRAVDIDRTLTSREQAAAQAAAQQAAGSGQGLPGGSYNGPTDEEIGRGIGVLIDLFGGGNTPHQGGQMGNHPKKR